MKMGQWEHVLVSSLSRLQNHHCAEVHAGREVVGWLSLDICLFLGPEGCVPKAPDPELSWCNSTVGGCPGWYCRPVRHPSLSCVCGSLCPSEPQRPFLGLGLLTFNGVCPH